MQRGPRPFEQIPPLPPLLGVPLMEWAIRRQFEAMLAEIERRAAMPSEAGAGHVGLRP